MQYWCGGGSVESALKCRGKFLRVCGALFALLAPPVSWVGGLELLRAAAVLAARCVPRCCAALSFLGRGLGTYLLQLAPG
jgi:hypothetical protein